MCSYNYLAVKPGPLATWQRGIGRIQVAVAHSILVVDVYLVGQRPLADDGGADRAFESCVDGHGSVDRLERA